MDFINSKFANSPTLRRIAIRVTVMPLLMFFSGLKEAAVMHLGPVGRVVDGAIKRFETACEILGAAKASGDALKTAAKDAVTVRASGYATSYGLPASLLFARLPSPVLPPSCTRPLLAFIKLPAFPACAHAHCSLPCSA